MTLYRKLEPISLDKKKYSAEDDATIIRMRREGKTDEEIAKEIDRHPYSVTMRMKWLKKNLNLS